MQEKQGIQVISRAADILRVLAADTDGQSLGQIAARANLPRSTVQRIVRALSDEGFVSTDGSSRGIRLGPELQSLAQAARADLKDRLRPMMRALSEETGETVDLAVLDGRQMLFVAQVEGSHRLRTVSRIGDTFPLTTTANGKAALAQLDPAEAAKLAIREFEAAPQRRPLTDFLAELDSIRAGALATDENEHTDGISALGLAFSDPEGEIFALSVPVPSSRFPRVRETLAAALLRVRAELRL